MTNLGTSFELAQLAEASYADFSDPGVGHKDALTAGGFSTKQASLFLDSWQLVANAHRPNTDAGYSSTLFKNKHDPTQYVLAFRGTEPTNWGDVQTDLGDIIADGIALDQIVDLHNEWQRLSTDSYHAAYLDTLVAETTAYQLAKAGSALPGIDMAADLYLATLRARNDIIIDEPLGLVRAIRFQDTATTGLGLDIAPGNLTVTGHSLGGHLAAAFTRLFPETGAQALTVNGAGFATGEVAIPGLALSATTNIRNLFGLLGGATSFDHSRILNLFGDRYPEVVTDNGELGLYQQGGHEAIYIEHVDYSAAFGHGGPGMTDSLAAYDLFIQLDASLQTGAPGDALTRLKPLFEAASPDDGQINALPQTNRSLENLINALARLFNTGVEIGTAQLDQREALYLAIDAIRSNSLFQQAAGLVQIQSLTGMNRDTLVARAQTDIAYRYALEHLNPFAITGDSGLYAQHNADGHLDAGQTSDLYLQDRAAMLTWVMQFNTQDVAPTQSSGNQVFTQYGQFEQRYQFQDIATNTQIRLDPYGNMLPPEPEDYRQIIFGTDQGETLHGNNGIGDRPRFCYRIERIEAGGMVLLESQVDVLVQAMAAFAPPAAGQTTLPSNYQQALAPVLAVNWQ